MPILRCSKEFYDFVTRRAMDTGNPASIILDRMLVEQPVSLKQLPLLPAQSPAKLKDHTSHLKPKFRCHKCGKLFHYWAGPIGAVAHRDSTHPDGARFDHLKLSGRRER